MNQAVIIQKIATNAVSIEDRINDIEKYSAKVQRQEAELNGMPITRLDVVSQENPFFGSVVIFIPRDGYYLDVFAPRAESTYPDFLTEGIMSTIEAK